MDETRQREIARKGGESVPAEKRSFSQNRTLAAEAGRKGGTSRGARTTSDGNTGNNVKPPQTSEERVPGYRTKNTPSQAAEKSPEEFDETEEDTDEDDADEEGNSSQYRN